jgi:hypothetical protein
LIILEHVKAAIGSRAMIIERGRGDILLVETLSVL